MSKPIQVLFDAGPLIGKNKTGVPYYTAGLISELAKNYPQGIELTGYYFNFLLRKNISFKEYETANVVFKPIWHFPGIFLSPLSRVFGFQLPIELFVFKKYDVQLFTNFLSFPSIRKTPQIITVHDLCFLDFPEYVQEKNLQYLKKLLPKSVKRASLILSVSDFTKERINHYFGIQNVQTTPVPVVGLQFKSTHKPATRLAAMGIQNKKYILTLGTVEPRKNLGALLDAYKLLPESISKQYSLVLAGGAGWKDAQILEKIDLYKRLGLNIIQTGYISDEEKENIYSGAMAFVLPSHYEGFGMPILEAMQFDIPVAVSDIPVFHEVAGDAGIYFDKDNPQDIADKLQILITKNGNGTLSKQRQNNLKRFSWGKNATVVYDAMEKLSKARVQ